MADDRAGALRVPLITLDAVTLRDRMATGALRTEEVARAFLAQIAAREGEVQAWAWLDEDDVIAQAQRLDALRRTGRPIGPLHGLPVGVKDVIDTARIPTENGTAADRGRVPTRDAAVVARLRAAGAVVMGKTVTTELAFLHPSRTRNPANPAHTPGGSSAGSAAAVAAYMVPLAIGTQTGGSVIRPASYCGCVGFKPSFGAIPRNGILSQSPRLDTVGVFARTVADAALLAEVLYDHDPADPATAPAPPPRLSAVAAEAPPSPPVLALVMQPGADAPEPDMADAMAELAETLGTRCFAVTLPPLFAEAATIRARINMAEMSKTYSAYLRRAPDLLSDELRRAMTTGQGVSAHDYIAALDWPDVLNAGLDEIFTRCDAILTPAAPGPAPGLATTGNPAFNGLWTLCGTPAVTIPAFQTADGLPMGLQLVGRRGDDARLLRTAQALSVEIAGGSGEAALSAARA